MGPYLVWREQSPIVDDNGFRQEKRDRVARLEEMTIAGRQLFEAKVQPVER